MKKHLKSDGFSVLEALLIVVIVGLIGGVGYYVYRVQNETKKSLDSSSQSSTTKQMEGDEDTTTSTKLDVSKITFENESSFDSSDKAKISSQIAEPLLFHHEKVLKIELANVTIKKSGTMMGSSDARYVLSYTYKDNPATNKFGFIFGYNNKIEYWQPQLCDDGGCMEYPAALKEGYPANHSAYVACKAANDAGDKEKASSLGCLNG